MRTQPNRALFQKLCLDFVGRDQERFNIGTYKEKKLHIIMKHYFENNNDYHEVPYKGYIADVKRDDRITEIQTTGFFGMKGKLAAYLPECKVNLVYPLAHKKNVAWIEPETGNISKLRRSPRKKGIYDVLFEMVRILEYVCDPNLTVTAVLLEMDEYRMLNGWSRDRKKGSERYEMIPIDICEIYELKTDADYKAFLPSIDSESFTAAEFAKAAGIPTRTVYGVLKVFEARGLIYRAGKRGRATLFSIT